MSEKILVVDDEESIRYTFSEILGSSGYYVETASTLSGCLEKMQAETFDLLLLDVSLGLDNGIEAIQQIKELQPDCIIIIITGNPRLQSLVQAKNSGAIDYLSKPVRQASLVYNVRKSLANRAA